MKLKKKDNAGDRDWQKFSLTHENKYNIQNEPQLEVQHESEFRDWRCESDWRRVGGKREMRTNSIKSSNFYLERVGWREWNDEEQTCVVNQNSFDLLLWPASALTFVPAF